MKYTSKEDEPIGLTLMIFFGLYLIVAFFLYLSEVTTEYCVAEATVTGYRDCNYRKTKLTTTYTHYYDCVFVDKDGTEWTAYFSDYTYSEERAYYAHDKVKICYTEPFCNGERVDIKGSSMKTILLIGFGGAVAEILAVIVYLQEKR